MIVALLGFMGSGKSSTGILLAQRLKYKFLDTDEEIVKKENRTIETIFQEDGEEYFRQIETDILKNIVQVEDNIVMATGGGIVISAENRQLLHSKTFPVLLSASPEEIYRRTKGGGRPLLSQPDPMNRIRQLLKKRKDYYHEFRSKVQTDSRTQEEVVEEIIRLMGADEYV